jgi:cytochrome c oxidase subunit II
MAAGAVVIWLAIIGLTVYAIRVRPEAHGYRQSQFPIIGGGAVISTIVLTVLLIYGLAPR